jgi:hypothetical protein
LREVTRVRSSNGDPMLHFVGSDGQVRFGAPDNYTEADVQQLALYLGLRLVDERAPATGP